MQKRMLAKAKEIFAEEKSAKLGGTTLANKYKVPMGNGSSKDTRKKVEKKVDVKGKGKRKAEESEEEESEEEESEEEEIRPKRTKAPVASISKSKTNPIKPTRTSTGSVTTKAAPRRTSFSVVVTQSPKVRSISSGSRGVLKPPTPKASTGNNSEHVGKKVKRTFSSIPDGLEESLPPSDSTQVEGVTQSNGKKRLVLEEEDDEQVAPEAEIEEETVDLGEMTIPDDDDEEEAEFQAQVQAELLKNKQSKEEVDGTVEEPVEDDEQDSNQDEPEIEEIVYEVEISNINTENVNDEDESEAGSDMEVLEPPSSIDGRGQSLLVEEVEEEEVIEEEQDVILPEVSVEIDPVVSRFSTASTTRYLPIVISDDDEANDDGNGHVVQVTDVTRIEQVLVAAPEEEEPVVEASTSTLPPSQQNGDLDNTQSQSPVKTAATTEAAQAATAETFEEAIEVEEPVEAEEVVNGVEKTEEANENVVTVASIEDVVSDD